MLRSRPLLLAGSRLAPQPLVARSSVSTGRGDAPCASAPPGLAQLRRWRPTATSRLRRGLDPAHHERPGRRRHATRLTTKTDNQRASRGRASAPPGGAIGSSSGPTGRRTGGSGPQGRGTFPLRALHSPVGGPRWPRPSADVGRQSVERTYLGRDGLSPSFTPQCTVT
jgi:hypothetical protein